MMPPEYHRDRYQTLKGLSLCTACGGKEPEPGKSKCHNCLVKRKESMRQLRARTPLPPKREKPRRVCKPAPRIKPKRVEDPEHLARVRSMPCIACQIAGTEQVYVTEAHHVRRDTRTTTYGRGQKAGDDEVIPLCIDHHWNGAYGQSKGLTLRWFESQFGNERDLLASTREDMKRVDTGP